MEDSLEDYIKIAGVQKNTKDNINNEKLANIKASLEIKKKCEDYAQTVVEFLIEGKLRPQIFLKSLNSINESLYDDVVDERSITKLCGYPLCGKTIPDMPDKKYIILSKVNKVFDLTDRKKFCSNFCYKASSHIRKQIDNSPIWLRKAETIYEYNLLPNNTSGLTPGEEIVNGVQMPEDEPVFTSVNAFTEACLDEAEDNLPDNDIDKTINYSDNLKNLSKGKTYENDHPGKSILKQPLNNDQELIDQIKEKLIITTEDPKPSTSKGSNNENIKKVQFIDNVIPTSASDEDLNKKAKEQKELNHSIQNICQSLNINLNLNKPNEEIIVEPQSVFIDNDKMTKAIDKVNESERERRKRPLLIDTKVNPENHSIKVKTQEAPKYTQRIIDISNHIQDKNTSEKDVNQITDKVKHLELNKVKQRNIQKNKGYDKKMQAIMDKIKNKKVTEKKGVILVNTIDNPELPKVTAKEQKASNNPNLTMRLESEDFSAITSAFKKWLTIETFIYLYGEDKVRDMINNDRIDSYFNQLKVSELQSVQQFKYFDICKRLQLKELQDDRYDSGCMSETSTSQQSVLKPMPDYNKLKEDMEDLSVKAQAFYSGEIVVKTKTGIEADGDSKVALPLVDVSNATAMRRNVFNKSILQYIKNHLIEISAPESTLCRVQDLIKTFKFDAKTVVFKPAQWTIIAIILINCVIPLDQHLKTEESTRYLESCIKKINNLRELLSETNLVLANFDQFIGDHILDNI